MVSLVHPLLTTPERQLGDADHPRFDRVQSITSPPEDLTEPVVETNL